MNSHDLYIALSRRVNATSYLKDLTKEVIIRWSNALDQLEAKSSHESTSKWLAMLDIQTLSEIRAYILSKEKEIAGSIPEDLPPISRLGIPAAGTVVLSGIVDLQISFLGRSNLDSRRYSFLRRLDDLVSSEDLAYHTFEALRRYLAEEMTMEANYQPVMIKIMLILGRAFRSEIAANLKEHNPNKQAYDYRHAEVFRTLRKNNVVRNEGSLFILNAEGLTFQQRDELIEICDKAIETYNKSHRVPRRRFIKYGKDDYGPIIAEFLRDNFHLECEHVKQNILRTPSGAIIHTKISSSKTNWYGLDKKIFDEFISLSSDAFLALSLDGPENTFIIPKERVLNILEKQSLQRRPRRTMLRWMIRIKYPENRYMITIDHSSKHHYALPYLNAWEKIPDISKVFVPAPKSEKIASSPTITMEDIEDKDHQKTPRRKIVPISRIVRDTVKSMKMKIFYEYRCQVCNYRVDSGSNYYSEVHHLWPLGEGGPDTSDNMLVLCPNHHVEFDYGVIGIDPADGLSVINKSKNIIGKLTFKEGHRLKIEYVEFQLRRMNI